MSFQTLIGILLGIGLVSLVVFCFRQGFKVKKSPEGVSRTDPVTLTMIDPPDRSGLP
jgi:hypothetical protein